MARVTEDLLRTIVELSEGLDCSTFIDTANIVVDAFVLPHLTIQPLLIKIELYLAAHFAALMDERGGLTRSMQGDASETYSDIYDKGFRSTRFGQQAIVLDQSGTLAAVSANNLKAQISLITTTE